ncbi:hypothetical protein [Sodalis-like endosymbiont of Proechinophthirus fluctus]|uniref:hypothetical protein n=1 Tax=Sodalis-like endosymbiont of Proechinophthirus fluctus TaxID=1462730 RepID=UPI0008372C7B|nr:hypothetical protein [Sodalis-like endosymbiont of Proechinophthirus fluctus]
MNDVHPGLATQKVDGHDCFLAMMWMIPIRIEANMLSHPDYFRMLFANIEHCCELGNFPVFHSLVNGESLPGQSQSPGDEGLYA